ncbi:DUF4349 domain-containing protein [Janibacter terrae]|uniref:DUF4349 domain-containing protein n=1 Tax=Janibacter TaxID=53457 RepID=UPI000ADDD67A|nr:DUF4349 domain-containing protein [Janibacter terrae]
MRTTQTRTWAALVAAGGIALAGCSAGGSEGGDAVGPESGASAASDSAAGSGEAAKDVRSAGSYKAPSNAHVARTARMSITVEDVEQASAKVRSAASEVEGYVSSEDSRAATDEGGRAWAEITVTVPVAELDATMTTLADVGHVTQRTSTAEDLSSQYTDTSSRVRTLTRSVERLRKLIASTEDLSQIVTLEDELSTREADLESMVSQRTALERRTTTAPVTVSLSTEPPPADGPAEDETGFGAGLQDGWRAFTSALEVGATVLGAVTPFAVTGLVLGGPLVWWLRRRTRRPGLTGTTAR